MSTLLKNDPIAQWWPNYTGKPVLIAGPCSAESEEQMLSTAGLIKAQFPNAVYRAGIWKPRTRPGSFEGIGSIGLKWMQKVKEMTGMRLATEVANAQHVEECLKHGIDLLWVGARSTVNPFTVQEIADALKGVDIPVLVKNPVNPDLQLWIGALERIEKAGIHKLGAIHRGFHTHETASFRNTPLWEIAVELKTKLPDLPMICDPSHICGNTQLIPYVAQKAVDLDMDGLMIETHVNPKIALSDAKQQLTPAQLVTVMEGLSVRTATSTDVTFRNKLDELREQISSIDDELLHILSRRMLISKKIGEYKRDNNVTVLQVKHWDELLKNRLNTGRMLGMGEDFVGKVFTAIHNESIQVQAQVMNKESVEGK
jgi:chorismate mutase